MDNRSLTLRELHLLEAAEAVVSSWEVYRDALRHEDGMVCALERLDTVLNLYHLATDGGE